MQGSLTVEVALRRFVVWRLAVVSVALLAAATAALWAVEQEIWAPVMQCAVGTAGALLSLLVARSLFSPPRGVLAFGMGAWTFRADGSPGVAQAVTVEVALDFGRFVLLLLTASGPALPRRIWLPAEAFGLEHRWQAFRCALFAPRPASADNPTAEGASPSR